MDAPFKLACPNCGKEREFSSKSARKQAEIKKTTCSSCRTARNNTKRKGTKTKESNPSWRGYKDIPGKTFSKLKLGADRRGLSFEITIQDIQKVYEQQDKICSFSGIPLLFGLNASIDRIDSSKGYTKDNIQIVHKTLNMMKRDLPNDEFLLWCKFVYKHNYD
jgi:uncharacterized Zn finger protein (UPF0148 family)